MAVEDGGAREVQTRFHEERQDPLLVDHQAILGGTPCYLLLLVLVRLHRLPCTSLFPAFEPVLFPVLIPAYSSVCTPPPSSTTSPVGMIPFPPSSLGVSLSSECTLTLIPAVIRHTGSLTTPPKIALSTCLEQSSAPSSLTPSVPKTP